MTLPCFRAANTELEELIQRVVDASNLPTETVRTHFRVLAGEYYSSHAIAQALIMFNGDRAKAAAHLKQFPTGSTVSWLY